MNGAGYRPEIDGLRAVAVIAVLLYHAAVPGFSGGYVGVDAFFVISGYLITGIIRRSIESGTFSIAEFYERRARRILPALCATLALTTLGAVLVMPPRLLTGYGESLIWTALSVSNFHFWKSSGYFAEATEQNPLIHTWSLAVEEQFYLVYPLILFLVHRFAPRRTFIFMCAGFVASLLLSGWAASHAPMTGFYLIPTRGWELLAGGLLTFVPAGARLRGRRADWACLAGLAMIALPIVWFDDTTPFPGFYALAPVGGTALLIAGAQPPSLAWKLLSLPPVVRIGLISYSLYLIHQPILALMRLREVRPLTDAQTYGALAVSLMLAYASWRWVERPFRNRNGWLKRRSAVFLASLGALTVLVVVGWGLFTTGGIPTRFDQRNLAKLEAGKQAPDVPLRLRDFDEIDGAPYVIGDAQASVRFAVVGDSHAWQLVPALLEISRRHGWRIDVFAKASCPPGGLDYINSTIRRRYHECVTWAERLHGIAPGYDGLLLTASSMGYRRNRADPISGERWKRHLDRYFSTLRSAGASAVWLLDTPQYPTFDPLLCVEQAQLRHYPSISACGAPAAISLDPVMRAAERAAAEAHGLDLVDLAAPFCNGQRCTAVLGQAPAMRDANHLSPDAALRLVPLLETAMARLASPRR